MKAFLDHIRSETPNIFTFWFKPEREPSYTAGQYIEMHLPHPNHDERGEKRWFTLSSSPSDLPLISITTKFATKQSSTFKTALRALNPGDVVDISSPMGDFVLPKDPSIPLVFVAGGIGITPFHSIIKFLNDVKEKRDIQFIYGVHSTEEQVFDELLKVYGPKQYSVIYQDPPAGWEGETGNLSGQRILDLIGEIGNKLIYVSGPEQMVETLHKELGELGVPKSQLVGDYFPNYSSI